MDALRRPMPPPVAPPRQMEEVVYKFLYNRAINDPLPPSILQPDHLKQLKEDFYRSKAKPVKQVFSNSKITKVVYCKLSHTKGAQIHYNIYHVKRADRTENKFSDVDLRNLSPYDLPKLLSWARKNYNTRLEVQRAYRVIKKTMREKLLLYSMSDFQVGLDLGVKSLNLPPPEDDCPSFARPNSIITFPKIGYVYRDPAGKLKLFLEVDCQKYATNTLLEFRANLLEHRGTEFMDQALADRLIEVIDSVISFRNLCFNIYRELKDGGLDNRKINDFPNARV